MRCRLILLITEHPIQQGIRKGGVRHFCDEDGRGRGRTEWRWMLEKDNKYLYISETIFTMLRAWAKKVILKFFSEHG